MRFYLHEKAEKELGKAAEYYESCREGLGLEFAQEVYAAIARICEYPNAWAPSSEDTRRCLVHRFPFGVIYRVKLGYVQIIAIADLRRRPSYWRRRR